MKQVMSSRLENVENMANLVKFECAKLGMEQVDSIELAITEALNNVIIHAHKQMSRIKIEVSVERINQAIRVSVKDCANSLDSSRLNNPLEHDLKNFSPLESGRGLAIIDVIMDQVTYSKGLLRMTIMLPDS